MTNVYTAMTNVYTAMTNVYTAMTNVYTAMTNVYTKFMNPTPGHYLSNQSETVTCHICMTLHLVYILQYYQC